MKVVKEAGGLTFYQKRSGRYAVEKDGQMVNGVEKVRALVEAGLIKAAIPEKEAPVYIAPEPEAAADEGAEAPKEEDVA